MKHPHQKTSLDFIIWLTLVLFSVAVVLIVGITEVLMVRSTFAGERKGILQSAGNAVVKLVESSRSSSEADSCIADAANLYDMSVQVFNKQAYLVYPFSSALSLVPQPAVLENIIQKLESEPTVNDRGAVMFSLPQDRFAFAQSVRILGEDMYLYIYSESQAEMTAIINMELMLVFVIAAAVIIALLIAYVIARQMGKPIRRLTASSRTLAKGDFSVHFTGDYPYAEINELANVLEYAKDELSKADNMQKELIANVTHDFKTPLTMIKAYAAMIIEISGNDPEKRNKSAQVIIDESDRLANLVNDILDISKIRSGISTLNCRECNISEEVLTIVDRFGYLEEQGYRIVTDVEDDLFTVADTEKIQQVVYNLLGNAINYTGEDKTVTVGVKAEGDMIHFTVTDTGKGISEEDLKTIWDRYYRSTQTHKRPVKGTGLGLSIVKTILVKHDFNYGVISEQGKGSTFYVDFPLMKE